MGMKSLTLRELQLLEFDMLCAFKAMCEKHRLYYTLCGGTLLGAVRHKGFIPWDDDIDVMLPRPDFNRLLENIDDCAASLPEQIQMVSWRNADSPYVLPFIKLYDTRTVLIDRYSHTDRHVWVDVFPVDGCPDDDLELNRFFHKVMKRRKLILLKNAKMGEGKTSFKRLLKPATRVLLAPFNTRSMCESYDRMIQSYRFLDCEQVACVNWGYGPQERTEKSGYMQPKWFEFEGEEFPGPSNYDAYLRSLYGDYMQLPPEDKRGTRHNIEVYMKG